jgi:hypothetical protein
LAVTEDPVVAESDGPGAHVYVTPPVALNTVEDPVQMATLEPPLIVGNGLTLTITVAVFTHPLASVPVTVYVIVEAGLAVTEVPVVADSDVPGAHV